jgi:hypothetical protein
MAESQDSTYEEATRCPKCGNPGNVRKKTAAPREANLPRGTTIHHVYCEHELCPWYDTTWMVQVNADGSVPPPKNHRGQPKIYQGFENHDQMARDITAAMEAQVRRETDPDQSQHEIRGPR